MQTDKINEPLQETAQETVQEETKEVKETKQKKSSKIQPMPLHPEDADHLPCVIEALLYVSGEPIAIGDIAEAFALEETAVSEAVDDLAHMYERERRGLCIVRFADKVQLGTRSDYAPYVDRLFAPQTRQSLSQSAIETLSIIAYRQPITRAEVEQIRGVKCEYAVSSLQAKGLIEEVGRKEALGRPILYGTTELFLRNFSLETIDQLPNREELIPTEEFQV